jgi:ABC-type transport system involved in multi-copper enzyme maturation permease subunit
MLRVELIKILSHRVPRVCFLAMIIGVVAPSVALIVYEPASPDAYGTTFLHVFQVLPSIVAIVFGGWVMGTEYRHDTVKRLVMSDPRRTRVLAGKAAAGGALLTTALATVAIVGWGAARAVGAMNDYTVMWNGRELLSGALFAAGAAVVAFALSVVIKSDALSMVATLALVLILDPLLSLIPRLGGYTFGGALETLTGSLSNSAGGPYDTSLLTNTQASITLAAWLTVFIGSAVYLFTTRDV